MKQAPEIKERRKLPSPFSKTQNRRLKADIVGYSARFIRIIILSFPLGFFVGLV